MQNKAKNMPSGNPTSKVRLLGVALAASGLLCVGKAGDGFAAEAGSGKTTATAASATAPAAEKTQVLPKLVDLGAIGCRPCKIMDGVLEELRKGYAGKLEVEFINVRTEAEKTAAYKISVIPTQIWLDASGKELFRHEGVMMAAQIAAKFKELGIDLGQPATAAETPAPAGKSGELCPPPPVAGNNGGCCP